MNKTSGLTVIEEEVKFGGLDIKKIVKGHGTPVMVFSEQRLIDNYNTLKSNFQKHYHKASIYYSIKTNYEPQILRTLRKIGSHGEAASALEILIAEKAGFKASEIILDGPAWTDEEIEFCIKRGVRTFNADSIDLLIRVNKVAAKLKKTVRVGFRINPEIKISLLKSFVEGFIVKFGVPISDAIGAYQEALKMKNVRPVAISTHIGSMITSPNYYEKTVDRLVGLAGKLRSKLNIRIEEINLGGGYGLQSLNYFSIQNMILEKAGISKYGRAPSIEEFGKRIGNRYRKTLKKNKLPEIELILEPGRFIVSDSGILITKVVTVKKNWIFIDGGINIIPESVFFLRRGFMVANKLGKSATRKYGISGPTLSTADVLALNQNLPKMDIGDIVIVLDAGAYSLSRSTQFTILRPKVLYITSGGRIRLLREEEKPKEFLSKLLI